MSIMCTYITKRSIKCHEKSDGLRGQYDRKMSGYTEVIALLGCGTALIGSYRRFGTAHRSNPQGSNSFGLSDPGRWYR